MTPTMSDAERLIKSDQEQAVAAWINHLNQLRLDHLLSAIAQQNLNLDEALASIQGALEQIGRDVVDLNRGAQRGMHGFIAEVAEVGIGNAREQVVGNASPYEWVNNNSPVDLVRDGVPIQQKFYGGISSAGLQAIAKHLEKYPDYIVKGGKYQIPSDQFEVIQRLHDMPPETAGKLLSRSGDGPSLKEWRAVQKFFTNSDVPFESLEPSKLEYAEVQRGTYKATLEAEESSLRDTDRAERAAAYNESRPSLEQAAQATVMAAVIEGGTSLALVIVDKSRAGKKLKDFSADDWLEIAGKTGVGTVTGGVRGISIYTLTNFTATPAAVASSIVTASLGIAEQVHRLCRGEISELEFIENAELVSLQAAVSALSSFVGQALVPVPVLGAVVGNTVGTIMYRLVSSSLSEREAALIEKYAEEQRLLDEKLIGQYQDLISRLSENMTTYLGTLGRAFSPNVQVALNGSVELALSLHVPFDEVLHSEQKARSYFLD